MVKKKLGFLQFKGNSFRCPVGPSLYEKKWSGRKFTSIFFFLIKIIAVNFVGLRFRNQKVSLCQKTRWLLGTSPNNSILLHKGTICENVIPGSKCLSSTAEYYILSLLSFISVSPVRQNFLMNGILFLNVVFYILHKICTMHQGKWQTFFIYKTHYDLIFHTPLWCFLKYVAKIRFPLSDPSFLLDLQFYWLPRVQRQAVAQKWTWGKNRETWIGKSI